MAVGGLAVLLGEAGRRHGAGRFALGALAVGWGTIGGLGGVVLLVLWAFTDHVMAYRNENLLQVNPLILALAVLVPLGLARSGRAARWARVTALGLAALSLAGLALQWLPGFDQVNGQVIALALPIHAGLALGVRRALPGRVVRDRVDRLSFPAPGREPHALPRTPGTP
jgi:hypothetical protein